MIAIDVHYRIAIHGQVYDITGFYGMHMRFCAALLCFLTVFLPGFMDDHPGGADLLRLHAGEDATREFDDAGHSSAAKAQLKILVVGRLKKA